MIHKRHPCYSSFIHRWPYWLQLKRNCSIDFPDSVPSNCCQSVHRLCSLSQSPSRFYRQQFARSWNCYSSPTNSVFPRCQISVQLKLSDDCGEQKDRDYFHVGVYGGKKIWGQDCCLQGRLKLWGATKNANSDAMIDVAPNFKSNYAGVFFWSLPKLQGVILKGHMLMILKWHLLIGQLL